MSRNELPYFPFYAKDFSADGKVEAMSTSEVGAYILLLCKAWHEEPPATIPSDDRVLARWTRLSMAEWEACKQAVLSCWRSCSDGRLIQPRLRKEYDKLQIRRTACVEAGKASAAQRSSNERSTSVQPRAYESGSDSGSALVSPEGGIQRGEPIRLLWSQVSPIYEAYPRHRRGGKGGFVAAVEPVWGLLHDRGTAYPGEVILAAVRAYAGSWLAKNDGGKAVKGPDRFFGEGVWEQNPADWGNPDLAPRGLSPEEAERRKAARLERERAEDAKRSEEQRRILANAGSKM